jgi:hypothetical protein
MKRHTFTIGAAVIALALSHSPAFAQAGSRPNTTGSSSGSAAPRGGDPGGGSSGGSTASSPSGGSSSGAVSRPSTSGTGSGGSAVRERAPERPFAVSRSGSSANAGSSESRPSGATRMRGAEAAAHAVPAYSRPNPGRNSVGAAVDRRDAPAPPPGSNIIYYPYNPYYYYDWRYGYSPYRYGLGYGFGFSHFGWYDPFMYSGGGYYTSPSYAAGGYSSTRDAGNLRLKVEPKHAEVYVDGYFVGTVDDFDGIFQKLNIDAGPHRIELRAEGFEPTEFEVLVTPRETVTYRGEMKPRMP